MRWTHLWGSVVPVKPASHPADETPSDADLIERCDCGASSSRHVGIEKRHGGLAVRKLVVLWREDKDKATD